MWVDAGLASLARIWWPLLCGRTVVCERFALDLLVDLMVGCDDPDLLERLPGRLYPRLLPPRSRVVVLDLDAATAVARRTALAVDDQLSWRLELYRRLAATAGLSLVAGIGTVENVGTEVAWALAVP
jgi:hypothetical protein